MNKLSLTALHYVEKQNNFYVKLGDNLNLSWSKLDITNINE